MKSLTASLAICLLLTAISCGDNTIDTPLSTDSVQIIPGVPWAWDACTAEFGTLNFEFTVTIGNALDALFLAHTAWTTICLGEDEPQQTLCLTALASAEEALILAEERLQSAHTRTLVGHTALEQIVADANGVGLGNAGVRPLPGPLRAEFAVNALRMAEAYFMAGIFLGQAIGFVGNAADAARGHILLIPTAVPRITSLGAAIGQLAAGEFVTYTTCAGNTATRIAALAAANFLRRMNGGGGGGGGPGPGGGGFLISNTTDPLNVHAAVYPQAGHIDLADAERVEEGATVSRRFRLGYEVPGDAFTAEDVYDSNGFLLVPAGTPLVVMMNHSDGLPTVAYTGGRIEVSGYGINLHYSVASAPSLFNVCIENLDDGMIEPGEQQFCTFSQDTTGTPEQIAAGEHVEMDDKTIYALGGNPTGEHGEGYYVFDVSAAGPREAPGPCYVWNGAQYTYDEVAPGCSTGAP